MKRSRGWVIGIVIVVAVIDAAAMLYPEWRSIVSDSGWYSLAFWISLAVLVFLGGHVLWPFIFDATNRWVVPHIVRILNRGDFRSTRKNR